MRLVEVAHKMGDFEYKLEVTQWDDVAEAMIDISRPNEEVADQIRQALEPFSKPLEPVLQVLNSENARKAAINIVFV